MTDYRLSGTVPRFQLDRRPNRSRLKGKCPKCGGEKCLTYYVDAKTGQPVGDEFGRCDHERRCGYDKRPTGKDVGDRELWVSNNEVYKAFQMQMQRDVTNYVPETEYRKTIFPDKRNMLFSFMAEHWGEDKTEALFLKYNVGTMDLWGWKGCAVFWQVDKDFTCRTGKIMEYRVTEGMRDVKRVKDDYPHVTFYHSLKGGDYSLKQCLFGEHLLNFHDEKEVVNLVESEKTALICSIEKPGKLFLATGGLQNLRPEVMRPLLGRQVVAHPDKGEAFDVWKEKIEKNLFQYNIEVSDFLQKRNDVEDGDDMADFIIKLLKKKK